MIEVVHFKFTNSAFDKIEAAGLRPKGWGVSTVWADDAVKNLENFLDFEYPGAGLKIYDLEFQTVIDCRC